MQNKKLAFGMMRLRSLTTTPNMLIWRKPVKW